MEKTVSVNGLSFKVDGCSNQDFWGKVESGRWEPETYTLFDDLITPDSLFLDIGAWIGSTALYAAQKSAKAIAFEPDPIAFSSLSVNALLNADAVWAGRLQLVNKAVNADGSDIQIGSRGQGGDSMSSALFSDGEVAWTVNGVSLLDVIAEHAAPNQPIVLKIDIEGGEYHLIPHIAPILAQPNVRMVLSLHPHFLQQSLLREFGTKWRTPFYHRHKAIVDALPRDRQVSFGRHHVRSRLLALSRALILGDFTRQIVLR